MDPLHHYIRVHLAGAAAGIDLFTRSSRDQHDQRTRDLLDGIRSDLRWEKSRLQEMARATGTDESLVLSTATRVGERLGRLKPNGSLVHRTRLTDLVELEAMRTAVGGKRAGWRGMLSVADTRSGLDRDVLEKLLSMADEQLELLDEEHTRVASEALAQPV